MKEWNPEMYKTVYIFLTQNHSQHFLAKMKEWVCVEREREEKILLNVITFTDWNRMPLGE